MRVYEYSLAQQQVADYIDCSSVVYSRYESGSRQPSIEVLLRLADLFGVTVDMLLGRHTDNDGKLTDYEIELQPTNSKNNCGAGCRYSRQYYKNKGRLYEEPQPGDQVFFYPADSIGGDTIAHTGLVCQVDASSIYTVEGNTSVASGVVDNGDGVFEKRYKRTNPRFAGFGRPDYGIIAESETAASASAPQSVIWYTVKKNDTLWGIAQRTLGAGAKHKLIMELNGLNSTIIHAGDVLKVPKTV